MSADIGDALLLLRLGRGCGLRGKLEHGYLLTLEKFRQEGDLPVRKFECVMMHPRLVLVDLPKDRRPVVDPSRPEPEESGCRTRDLPRERKLRSRKDADRRRGIFGRGESTCAEAEIAGRQLVVNLGSTRLHIV